ncbi:acyl carrier protein [Streptomyces sp. NPDC005820]|uniref:acyl carrier protein n=1 Tax=Streptomyces sp. NPDC005820 TaxID=3157069 RepID=UPI0033E09DE0
MTTGTEDKIFDTLREVITRIAKVPPETVVPDAPVSGLQNVDSIVLLEIVVTMENELGIEIDEEELFDIDTVGQFVAACRRIVEAG